MISAGFGKILRYCTTRVLRRGPALMDLTPDHPLYVIGDIHGRFDLLQALLHRLSPDIPIVCVGDYVDRGEDSAGVLRFLCNRKDIICLKGNHEDMLLQFLDWPLQDGARWLRNGGLQTLASFGVSPPMDLSDEKAMSAASAALRDAMGKDLVEWIRDLPLWHQSGNVFVTHAGADPALPVPDQDPRHLLWGHPAFLKQWRTDGIWIVHGHTIVNAAAIDRGRISIDTGAYATGRLTAVRIDTGKAESLVTHLP